MISIEKTTEKSNIEELISKKDLLAQTKISYGQLYRWKRMNIIPEDWFIKKSASTGQETFFKKDKILERINLILSMKDDVSLDEIAELFNKTNEEEAIEMDKLIEKGIIKRETKDLLINLCGPITHLGKKELIVLSVIEKYLLVSKISMEEVKLIVDMLNSSIQKLYHEEGKIILYRKFGISFIVGCKDSDDVIIDASAIKIIEIELMKEVGEIKKKLL